MQPLFHEYSAPIESAAVLDPSPALSDTGARVLLEAAPKASPKLPSSALRGVGRWFSMDVRFSTVTCGFACDN